jgi:hypothetical protein
MPRQKLFRNDPCPCGSGKKYKLCCHGKDIDWSARAEAARRPLLPRMVGKPAGMSFGQYGFVDTKLKSIAKASPETGEWKALVERLSEATSSADRMKTYKAIREGKVIPDEAADFLIGWAIQWMPPESDRSAPRELEEDDLDEEAAGQKLDKETLTQLRGFGMDDMAEMFVGNRLEFDRRHDWGRQFFHGPPDGELAKACGREALSTDCW